jgi:hypothetical protein
MAVRARAVRRRWGDYYLYFGTVEMGLRDGMPGVFTVQENRSKEGNSLVLRPRDAIEHPNGRGAFETMWLGYYCVPQGATHTEPRYYPFTENRLMWMIDWSVQHYGADPQRVSMGGSSMGGLGSINVGFRHPERFAAVYPSTAPFLWWPPSSLHGLQKRVPKHSWPTARPVTSITRTAPNSPPSIMRICRSRLGRRVAIQSQLARVRRYGQALTTNHHGFCFAWNDGGHSRAAGP